MSDIHGQDSLYFKMLEEIGFNHFKKEDHIYILGDVVDRGPGSIKILEHICKHTDQITLLMGNHEKMMIDAYIKNDCDLWFYNGGDTTYDEFMELSPTRQQELFIYLEQLSYDKVIMVQGQEYYLVHGSPYRYPDKEYGGRIDYPDMEPRNQMLWQDMQPEFVPPHKIVVFGHRVTSEYHRREEKNYQYGDPCRIYHGPNMIGMDCGCAGFPGGRLACLRLEDRKEYYSKLL